jgi:hypothetical protein
MPAFGSGLSAQVGVKAESTVGTEIVVDTFYEFLDESFQYVPTWLDGMGLKANQQYQRVARTVISRHDVNGGFTVEHADKGHMGLLWKHALGSTVTTGTLVTGTAYKQNHTPGTKFGMGLTTQIGRPQPDTTVRAFTYRGCKVTDWEFSCSDGAIAALKLMMDGWQEATATALASATYTAGAGVFNFADASTFKIGGTASTSAGETTIASGVQVATLAKSITITGTTPLAVDRYGLGNAGVKKEQLENDIPVISGSLGAEFTQRTEFYDLLKANTTVALQLDFSHYLQGVDAAGATGGTGTNPYLLSFIFPAVKIRAGSMNVGGPDIVPQQIDFKAYDDGSGTNPVMQVKLVGTDLVL